MALSLDRFFRLSSPARDDNTGRAQSPRTIAANSYVSTVFGTNSSSGRGVYGWHEVDMPTGGSSSSSFEESSDGSVEEDGDGRLLQHRGFDAPDNREEVRPRGLHGKFALTHRRASVEDRAVKAPTTPTLLPRATAEPPSYEYRAPTSTATDTETWTGMRRPASPPGMPRRPPTAVRHRRVSTDNVQVSH